MARGGTRYAILRLLKHKKPEMLLVLAHLPPKSPGPNSADNQRSVALDLLNEIRLEETNMIEPFSWEISMPIHLKLP